VQVGRCERILEVARREGRFEDLGWRVRKDGTRFFANVVITPVVGPHGEPLGFSKVTRDLTERLGAEATLRQSEDRFRRLVEGATDYAIFMLDPTLALRQMETTGIEPATSGLQRSLPAYHVAAARRMSRHMRRMRPLLTSVLSTAHRAGMPVWHRKWLLPAPRPPMVGSR